MASLVLRNGVVCISMGQRLSTLGVAIPTGENHRRHFPGRTTHPENLTRQPQPTKKAITTTSAPPPYTFVPYYTCGTTKVVDWLDVRAKLASHEKENVSHTMVEVLFTEDHSNQDLRSTWQPVCTEFLLYIPIFYYIYRFFTNFFFFFFFFSLQILRRMGKNKA